MMNKMNGNNQNMDINSIDHRVNFKMNAEKYKQLQNTAKARGVSSSLIIRLLIDDFLEESSSQTQVKNIIKD